jgi:hypothetical protein
MDKYQQMLHNIPAWNSDIKCFTASCICYTVLFIIILECILSTDKIKLTVKQYAVLLQQ